MKKLMSYGNRKLPTTTAIFNLPAVKTCPNATKECIKYCYARKAERMYPQVLPFRNRNLKKSKQKNFVKLISDELSHKQKITAIRAHESGDIYSQSYFDKWVNIANKFKDKIFYAYTKSFWVDLKNKPSNFIMIASDDMKKYSNQQLKKMGYDGRSRVENKGYVAKKGEFICPGSCKSCTMCYSKSSKFKNIVFHKH